MRYPAAIQNLINHFTRFPSVGPKTAERYVFNLLKQPREKLEDLARAISELQTKTARCGRCLMISESDPCPICADEKRKRDILCIIESTQDVAAIEATGQFDGLYFVLGGLINTLENIQPEDINIEPLLKRLRAENVKELIIALDFTLEGETTAMYLNKILKDKMRITRLAKGLPAGSDLEYADEITLSSAFKNRGELK